ncbi:MAG TPA: GYD domain-containing protein [Candidatus Sulfotelmatobacter sp.]|nr:GYD domain-containing protein [Candidatus Sulfotelmatobacter sp.]
MPKYAVFATYESEAVEHILERPADRAAVMRRIIEAAGGRQEQFYWMLGPYDSLGIVEMPDAKAMTAVAMASISAHVSKRLETFELIDHVDIPAIAGQARSLTRSYSVSGEEG